MKKYSYKNKVTGQTVQSDVPLKDKNLVLISQVRGGINKKIVKTK